MLSEKYKLFHKIIEKHLESRKNLSSEDVLNGNWLDGMFSELQYNIPNSTKEEIKTLDNLSMGHIDYHHKFALRCDELYQNKTQ